MEKNLNGRWRNQAVTKQKKKTHTSVKNRKKEKRDKILAKKCSGKLNEITQKLKAKIFREEDIKEIYEPILTGAKALIG